MAHYAESLSSCIFASAVFKRKNVTAKEALRNLIVDRDSSRIEVDDEAVEKMRCMSGAMSSTEEAVGWTAAEPLRKEK